MAVRRMDKRASENKYLHRDFHISADKGLRYVAEKYGDDGVKEYLQTFAARYYAPLIGDIKSNGLSAVAEHLKSVYFIEEAPDALELSLTDNRLDVHVLYSPAIRYMNKACYTPSRWYAEQTRTVFGTVADLASISFVMTAYNEKTGEAEYSFSKIV